MYLPLSIAGGTRRSVGDRKVSAGKLQPTFEPDEVVTQAMPEGDVVLEIGIPILWDAPRDPPSANQFADNWCHNRLVNQVFHQWNTGDAVA